MWFPQALIKGRRSASDVSFISPDSLERIKMKGTYVMHLMTPPPPPLLCVSLSTIAHLTYSQSVQSAAVCRHNSAWLILRKRLRRSPAHAPWLARILHRFTCNAECGSDWDNGSRGWWVGIWGSVQALMRTALRVHRTFGVLGGGEPKPNTSQVGPCS